MNDILTAILDITTIDVLSSFPVGRGTRGNRGRRTFYIPLRGTIPLETHTISPVVTSDFVWNKARMMRKRRRSSMTLPDGGTCCVCLEPMTKTKVVELPCHHHIDLLCLASVIPNVGLGSRSMIRCPLCRYELDRYDLQNMGFLVTPQIIKHIERCCHGVRRLTNETQKTTAEVARLVRSCVGTCVSDGLVYNTCILAIERALHHKMLFIRSIEGNLQQRPEAIDASLACHVEVLMHLPPDEALG